MAIIDVHCHILPGVDDGAKDIETSLAMLEASRDQGVQCMVATLIFMRDGIVWMPSWLVVEQRGEHLWRVQKMISAKT